MLIIRNALFKNSIYNIIGEIVPALVAFIAIPIILNNIGISKFGLLSLMWVVVGYFSIFDFGVGKSLTRVISDKKINNNKEKEAEIFWTSLILLLIFGIVGGGLLYIIGYLGIISPSKFTIDDAKDYANAIKAISLSVPLVVISIGVRGYLEGREYFFALNIVRIIVGTASFLFPMIISYYSHSLLSIAISLIFSRLLGLILNIILSYKIGDYIFKKIRINSSIIPKILVFGGYLTISNILSPLMVYMDRFFISIYLPLSSVAYYTTPFDLVTKILIIPRSIAKAYFPKMVIMNSENRSGVPMLYQSIFRSVALTLPIVVIALLFSEKFYSLWLDSDFSKNCFRISQILCLGILINSIGQMLANYIHSKNRADVTAKIHLAEIVIYVPLLLCLIHLYGLEGAAIAWGIRVLLDTLCLAFFAYSLSSKSSSKSTI